MFHHLQPFYLDSDIKTDFVVCSCHFSKFHIFLHFDQQRLSHFWQFSSHIVPSEGQGGQQLLGGQSWLLLSIVGLCNLHISIQGFKAKCASMKKPLHTPLKKKKKKVSIPQMKGLFIPVVIWKNSAKSLDAYPTDNQCCIPLRGCSGWWVSIADF